MTSVQLKNHMKSSTICCKRCNGASQSKEHRVAQCYWEEDKDIQGSANEKSLAKASTIYSLGAALSSDEIKRKFKLKVKKTKKIRKKGKKREMANKSSTDMNWRDS